MRRTVRFQTTDEDQGFRLDQVLGRHVDGLSRTKARIVLSLGGVFLDGKRTKVASRLVRAGQEIRVHLGASLPTSADLTNDSPFELVVHFEDAELLVVDKPSGWFSAPTPEGDRNCLLTLLEKRAGHALHLIHRLDRPTSGLLVFTKTPRAAAHLGAQFQVHSIDRVYRAIAAGAASFTHRIVEDPLDGKPARTEFTVLEVARGATLLAARLFTGRTHQVRLHAESIGLPLAGDSKYGRFAGRLLAARPPRLALHAEQLAFDHPDGRRLAFTSPFPAELHEYWTTLGNVATDPGR